MPRSPVTTRTPGPSKVWCLWSILDAMAVLRIEDHGVIPLNPRTQGIIAPIGSHPNHRLRSFRSPSLAGPALRYEATRSSGRTGGFRVGFTPKEGLVLYTLSFQDGIHDRPLVYRASLSELVVPYGDTAGDHYMNHSFDLGETMFGSQVNSLRLGCDCLGGIHFFSFDMADDLGEVKRDAEYFCLHEEDYGVLWKHTDTSTGNAEVRRSRRLVISSFFTIGNYDYGIFWYLYLDGSIEFEAKLTGTLYLRAIEDDELKPYGARVAPRGQRHGARALFQCPPGHERRRDQNTVVEVESQRVPTSSENPYGNAHGPKETVISSEKLSGRDIAPGNGRFWKVINRSKTSNLGWHPGYKLVPARISNPCTNPIHLSCAGQGFSPTTSGSRLMIQINYTLLALTLTRTRVARDSPNGFRPTGPSSMQMWSWHNIGVVHLPRPEDFPVMPVEYIGFMLKPVGFFERNPALNLAPPQNCHS
ncbi:MAG: hypothetical protein Ct9H300mP16_17150 [Pseudomonadota bacterium]|nr:MAG: hypothetical protein Ct9H300mP16_17150 [Pseudomonadota bacterium]